MTAHAHRHPHVHHAERGARATLRDRGAHPGARRERTARVARAIHRLGEDRVGLVVGRLDDHVVGLGDLHADLVRDHRLHVLPAHGDHRHREPGNPDVEVGARSGVDEAESNSFATPEQPRPVGLGGQPVEEVGVGRAGDVGDVDGAHSHLRPREPILDRRSEAHAAGVLEEVAHRAPLEVVVRRLLLEVVEDLVRILERPVGQHHHVLAVVLEGLGLDRIDDEWRIVPDLLLHSGVAVVPVRAVLPEREAVRERLSRANAGEIDVGHAVHRVRDEQAVPVDRRVLPEPVVHVDDGFLPLAKAQEWTGNGAVDRGRRRAPTPESEGCLPDGEVEWAAGRP